MPAHTTLFIRREKYLEVGYYKTDYTICADFDFICRAFVKNRLSYRYVPKIITHMQTGGLSSAGFMNTLTLNKEILRACRENDIDGNWIKLGSKYPLKLLEFLPWIFNK